MKHADERPYADPEAAARKLVELAASVEAVQDGRIYIERINAPFLFKLKGSGSEFGVGLPAGHFKFLRVWSVKFLHPRGRTRDC
ncbi:hypothetical protein [Bradyrhizobium japonicum]|uniref:hypothetical protein n=1 Tax=Bradyrhizobium japonicum TaxID=375 RepID=UPI00209D8A0A|nr:hypothetical protein [Bradyrhizobium japonicum]MCP1761015.1 hypothetical protein [Bradyrhizobium japonicum]MCP1792594.1 hypothetical protein [Bradyrhizobium japonicum]MCP1805029.1 hypothetical protein [Bradyrhizobium japonicum]MCP1814050.1 hypothetical protein [Bradyrhizobium japonicum]MCP1874528.1 hypothetical protein [Bradyrhizobium japonicum]